MVRVRVIISHAYSIENKGDAALLEVLVQDIRRQYGQATHVDILTIDEVESTATFAGAPLHKAFMYYALNSPRSRLGKLLYALTMIPYTTAWAWLRTRFQVTLPLSMTLRSVADMYEQADMVITVGGGYFRTSGTFVTFINLLLMLHPLAFARMLQTPTYLYTMSVGPFYSGVERWLVARQFAQLPLILIREDTSVKLLKSMGITDNVQRSVDSGFLFESTSDVKLRHVLRIEDDRPLVGVTARKWLDVASQNAYEQELASALDSIIATHHVDVVFIPQVTSTHNHDDDREVSRSIASRMAQSERVHVMEDDYTHHDVKAMYDSLDYIIGTRFHSVIFSLTSRVPAIAVEYEHKTSGIMRDLSLSKWTLKIESVQAERITELFARLIEERKQYVEQLDRVLPPYIAQAADAISYVADSYASLAREERSTEPDMQQHAHDDGK